MTFCQWLMAQPLSRLFTVYCTVLKDEMKITNLLLACCLVFDELAPIVYSTKHFIDQYRNSHLQRLQSLTPTAIQSLAKLTVSLNVSSCEPGWSCCKEQPTHSHHDCAHHDESLSSRSILQYQGHYCNTKKSFQNGIAQLTILHHIFNPLVFIYTSLRRRWYKCYCCCRYAILNWGLPILAECNIYLSKGFDLAYAKFSSFFGALSHQTHTCLLSSSFTPLSTQFKEPKLPNLSNLKLFKLLIIFISYATQSNLLKAVASYLSHRSSD